MLVFDVETMYGMKFWPSNNADDALPKEEETNDPDTINILSDSTIGLEACVFCNGTIVN